MTTKADVLRQAERARQAAHDVYDAVVFKRNRIAVSPTLWGSLPAANGYVDNAALNLATIEMLPEILDDALAQRPDEVGQSLAQALVVVEQTGEATERYAAWSERSELVALVRTTWAAFVELVADLAHEVVGAILVIGKRAASGLGWVGLALGALALGGVAIAVSRRS